jgi:hypothetical protein
MEKPNVRLAKFKRLGEHPFECVQSDIMDGCVGYVRISEYVDVEFPPLREAAVIEKHLEQLDNAEAEIRTKFQLALNSIEQQRQELRAITYRPE